MSSPSQYSIEREQYIYIIYYNIIHIYIYIYDCTWVSKKEHNHPLVIYIYIHITWCYLSYLVFTCLRMFLKWCFTRKSFQLWLQLSISQNIQWYHTSPQESFPTVQAFQWKHIRRQQMWHKWETHADPHLAYQNTERKPSWFLASSPSMPAPVDMGIVLF